MYNIGQGRIEKIDYDSSCWVYNPTHGFMYEGKKTLAARVEPRNNPFDSKVKFFQQDNDAVWRVNEQLPTFKMEDPFISVFNGEYLLGGVEVDSIDNDILTGYRTVFYSGRTLNDLHKVAHGPESMKDIRLLPLENGKTAVFARPKPFNSQTALENGRIAFAEVTNLDELLLKIPEAVVLPNLYTEMQWGGSNQVLRLQNGNVSVLAHEAYFDEKGRNYDTTIFEFDMKTKQAISENVLVQRDVFPMTEAKTEELFPVVFPGGIAPTSDTEIFTLYAGISDAAIGTIDFRWPLQSLPVLSLY